MTSHAIKVRALANVMGMVRGNDYVLNANATVDALIDRGFVVWIDQPAPEEQAFDLTPEVQKRVVASQKPAVEKSVRQNPAQPSNEIVPPKIKPSPKTSDEKPVEELSPEEAADELTAELADDMPLSDWSESKRKLDVQSGPEFYDGK